MSTPVSIKYKSHSNQANIILIVILFILSPFITLLVALKNYNLSWSKTIVWFFIAYYGFTFYVAPDSTSDSHYYARELQRMYLIENAIPYFLSYITLSAGFQDVYQPVISLLVSRFTSDYRYLFALFGMILGYFYANNVWTLLKKKKLPFDYFSLLLILVFVFIVSIGAGINGVRMWTAAHIFIFGAFLYFNQNRTKGLTFIAMTILVHFSYLFPVLLFISYLFLHRFKTPLIVYFSIFVLSFFLNVVDFELGRTLVSYLPQLYESKASSYVSEATEKRILETGTEIKPWFYTYGRLGLKYGSFILAVFLFFNKRFINANSLAYHLFSFGLLSFGLSNILSYLPSVSRYITLSNLFLWAAFFIYYQYNTSRLFKFLIFFISPGLLLYIAFEMRMVLQYPSYWLIVGNPFMSSLTESDTNIYQLIALLLK